MKAQLRYLIFLENKTMTHLKSIESELITWMKLLGVIQ